MKKLALACVAASALLLGTLVVGVGPSSAAASKIGYTIIFNEGGCDLATLDLDTGELTDLPAPSSPEACVDDIAADSEGAVWGIIDGGSNNSGSIEPAAVTQSQIYLVAFESDGTPNVSPIFFDDIPSGASLENGGIAFGPAGTYIQAYLGDTNTTCNAGVAVCLLTYDPETGLATPIGGSGLIETSLYTLTDCASGQYTLFDIEGPSLGLSNRTTGEVTPGPSVDDGLSGMDCAPGGSTLYAISSPPQVLQGNGLAANDASVGTLNPTTGQFTAVAPVSDPDAFIGLLAVPGTPVPTTTTQPAAVAADTVTPAFTG
jgi:hypothetical protein